MRFAANLTNEEMKLAREFDDNNICSLSRAVKAFDRGETDKIEAWKKLLEAKKNERFSDR